VELLRQIGLEPSAIEGPGVDETPHPRELPKAYARRLAAAKAGAVADRQPDADRFVLGADTVVACGRRILPKATEAAVAERCLKLLSGRRHRVYTGVTILAPAGRRAARVVMTSVRFKRLARDELDAYLTSGEWQGKAGGYGIQGRAEAFTLAINGSWSNVVGLPLADTVDLLRGLGWRFAP
jgi:nucleoside triphosphate pyrophosphatase